MLCHKKSVCVSGISPLMLNNVAGIALFVAISIAAEDDDLAPTERGAPSVVRRGNALERHQPRLQLSGHDRADFSERVAKLRLHSATALGNRFDLFPPLRRNVKSGWMTKTIQPLFSFFYL
jgi:hypothetical protein